MNWAKSYQAIGKLTGLLRSDHFRRSRYQLCLASGVAFVALLVAGAADRTVDVQTLLGTKSALAVLEFSPDGTHLVSIAGRDVAVWSMETKRSARIAQLPSEAGRRSLAWHPGGK